MKMQSAYALATALTLATSLVWAAEGGATKDDAVAMVKKAVAAIKAQGAEKMYAEISDKANANWHLHDLYLTVYQLEGTVQAHGANAKMIGKNLIELKDIDGKPFVKERMDLATTNASFWQDYKFTNPETKKIEPKSMYCEKLSDTVVCGGIYK